jgi:hypothetical protein
MLAVIMLFVFGLVGIDDGATFSFYRIGLLLSPVCLIGFGLLGKQFKKTLNTEATVAVDTTGYYRCLLLPALGALCYHIGVSVVVWPFFFETSLPVKFAIRFLLHMPVSQILLFFLRRLVFRAKFIEYTALFLLLLPGNKEKKKKQDEERSAFNLFFFFFLFW